MSDEPHKEHQKEYHIQIDSVHYSVTANQLTGTELRNLPSIPIGPDRDLFEVIPSY